MQRQIFVSESLLVRALVLVFCCLSVASVAVPAGDEVDDARFRIRRQIYHSRQVRNLTASTSPTFSSIATPTSSSVILLSSPPTSLFPSVPGSLSPEPSKTSASGSHRSLDQSTTILISDYRGPGTGLPAGTSPRKQPTPPSESSKLIPSSGASITGPPVRGAPSGTAPGTKTRPPDEVLSPIPSGVFPGKNLPSDTAPGRKPSLVIGSLGPIFPFPGGQAPFATGCRPGTVTVDPKVLTITETKTSTIIANATITLPTGAKTPTGVLITPLPVCSTENLKRPFFAKPNVVFQATMLTTLLVTSKSQPVTFTPTSVPDLYPSSIEKLPVKSPVAPVNEKIPGSPGPGSPQANKPESAPKNSPAPDRPQPLPSPNGPTTPGNGGGKTPGNGGGATPGNGGGTTPGNGGGTNPGNGGGTNPGNGNGGGANPGNGGGTTPGNGGGTTPGKGGGANPGNGGGTTPGNGGGTTPGNGGGTTPSNGGGGGGGGTNSNGNGSPHALELNPSVVTVKNIPVSIGPAGVFVNSQKIPVGASPTTLVIKGQTIAVEPSRILFAETTIPLIPKPNPSPAKTVNIGNVPVILRPNNVVIGSKTFTPGASPTDIVHNGQTFQLDSSRLISPQTTIALPQAATPKAAKPSLVTAGGQVFTLGPSGLQAPGITVPLPQGPKASSFIFKGQTFKLSPSQIIASDRFVALPHATQSPHATFVLNGQTFSVDASRFIAPSTTISLSPGSKTIVYNGQTITLGQSQIIGPSTTISFAQAPQGPITAAPSAITAGGIKFSLGPSAAIFGSKTYSFLPGQAPTNIVFHGQTISIGPNGVGFAGTTIPIPTSPPRFSTVTAGALTFSVGASEAVIGGHTFVVGPNIAPTSTVVNGQKISIGPHGIGLAGTTVPLLNPATPSLSAFTAGGLTFSLASNEAVFGGHTFKIGPGSSPITTVINGQTVSIGPQGIGLASTTVPLPNPSFSTVTAGGLTFSLAPNEAVFGGHTFTIGPGSSPVTTVINGQTVSIGPQGIGLASTTVPLPNPSFSTVTAGGLTFSLASNEAVLGGHTFTIGPGSSPTTTVINGQTISIGPNGIGLATTTVALPSSQPSFSVVTEGDLTLSLSPSEAVISGKTFSIGPGSVPITTTINGQLVTIGPKGIGFAGTTAALPSPTGQQSPSLVTADGLTFSVEPTDVVISGTTYPIGPGATPTTIVIGNETVSLGPGGIGLPSTTILPPLPTSTGAGSPSRASSISSKLYYILIPAFLTGFLSLVALM